MSVFYRDIDVKISDYKSELSKPLVIYERDRGLEIYFNLKEYAYKYDKNPSNLLENLTGAYATVTLVNPTGFEISIDEVEITEEAKVKFIITEDLTDELTEIGTYQLQIHVNNDVEGKDTSVFSIPPFNFEVRERLKGSNGALLDSEGNGLTDKEGYRLTSTSSNKIINFSADKINEYLNSIPTMQGKIRDISSQLDANKIEYTNKINNLDINKRIFKPPFGHCVDWSSRTGDGSNWAEEKIKNEIDSLIEYGVEEISVTIQIKCRNGVVSLVSDLDLFKRCLDYAREKGLKTKMIKIHCNEFRNAMSTVSELTDLYNQWYALVESVGDSFKGYCNYLVPINEGDTIFTNSEYESFLLNCLNKCKQKGFKCGFTPSSAKQWDRLPETVKNSCDFIAFNCYPTISLKGLNTTYEDVVNAFEVYELNLWINSHKEKYNKEIFITEIGCDDRASCLACTYVWDFGNGEGFNNGKIQKIMLKGIFETLKNNDNLSGIFYWYPFRGDTVKETIKYYVGGTK